MNAKKKKDPTRVYLFICLNKILAYHAVGNKEEATSWAHMLVTRLKRMGILPKTMGVDKTD